MRNNKSHINLKWFHYHFLSFFEMLFVFNPLRIQRNGLRLIFRPGSPTIVFIFAFVIVLIIILPLVLFIGNLMNGYFIPEILIVSAFGVVFGSFFRYAQGESCSYIVFNQYKLKLVTFGFWQKNILKLSRNQLKGLVKIRNNFQGTNNYKICIVTEENKLILIYLTIFKRNGNSLFNKYSELLKLKQIEKPPQADIINDLHIKF